VEAEVRIPKVGKTTWHWVLEALMILVSVGLAFGELAYSEKLLIDLYRQHLPAIRAAAR
jgi:hypothetical protein